MAVIPGDVIVANSDGAVVIPQALLEDVIAEAPAQEKLAGWIIEEVARRKAARSLPDERATKARYEAWLASEQSNA